MPDLAPLKLDVIARTSPFVRELGKARKSAMSFAGTVRKQVGGALLHIGKIGATTAAAGLTAVTAAAAASVKEFASFGDSIHKASKRTGASAKVLSELSFAAERSGASLADVEQGFRGMARFSLNVDRGLKSATDTLSDLGLNAFSLSGKGPGQQFELLADAISRVPDATKRAALAMQVFGRSGTTLLPLMEDGSKGIRELREEASKLGFSLSDEAAESAARLTDSATNLNAAFKGMRMRFAEGVTAGGKIEGMFNAVAKQIASIDAGEVGRQFGSAVGEMIKSLAKLVEAFGMVHRATVSAQNFGRQALARIAEGGPLATIGTGGVAGVLKPFLGDFGKVFAETARNQAKQATEDSKKVQNAIEQLARSIRAVGFAAPAAGKRFDAGPFEAPPAPEVIAKKTAEFFAGMFAKGAKRKGGLLPGEREPVLTGGGPLATPFSQPRLSSAAQFGTGGALSALNRARTGQSTDGQKIVEELRKLGTRLREIHVALAKNPPTRLVPAGLDRA